MKSVALSEKEYDQLQRIAKANKLSPRAQIAVMLEEASSGTDDLSADEEAAMFRKMFAGRAMGDTVAEIREMRQGGPEA